MLGLAQRLLGLPSRGRYLGNRLGNARQRQIRSHRLPAKISALQDRLSGPVGASTGASNLDARYCVADGARSLDECPLRRPPRGPTGGGSDPRRCRTVGSSAKLSFPLPSRTTLPATGRAAMASQVQRRQCPAAALPQHLRSASTTSGGAPSLPTATVSRQRRQLAAHRDSAPA